MHSALVVKMGEDTAQPIPEKRIPINLDAPVNYGMFTDAVGRHVGGESQFGMIDTQQPPDYLYRGFCKKCPAAHVYHYLTELQFTVKGSNTVRSAVLVTKTAPDNIAELVVAELRTRATTSHTSHSQRRQ